MFCPACKAEYRPGFTRCSDCDVPLVDRLPEVSDPDVPKDAEGRELLWRGVSSRFYDAIRAALDAAGIPHTDVEKEFGVFAALTQTAEFIWIEPSAREAAQAIVARILAEPDAAEDDPDLRQEHAADAARVNLFGMGRRLYHPDPLPGPDIRGPEYPLFSSEPADSSDTGEPTPDDTLEDFDSEQATTEVWAGDDAETAQFLADSLRGVGIGCVISENGGKSRVLVLPADQSRAREIVREVVEGAPPE